VTSIGVFTPEQARMLWQDYLARQQLPAQQTQHFPQRRPADDVAQHRVLVKNTTEEEIPQFACMRVTGVSLVGDRTVIEVEKPSSTDGEFLFNCEYAIPVEDSEADPPQSGVGWAYRYGIVRALGPEPDEAGELYGPVVDSWEIEPGGTLFNVYGRDDRNENGLIGRFAGGGGGGGTEKILFEIKSIARGVGLNCNAMEVEVLNVSCGATIVSQGDIVIVYDELGCVFNGPEHLLFGKRGYAVRMENPDYPDTEILEFAEGTEDIAVPTGLCRWAAEKICCIEESV
jgi:hypothetical protein